MGTPYYDLGQIVQRLRTHLPISLTLNDPFTGQPIEIKRENMLIEMIVDTKNLGMESQLVPALYMEFARFHRAAEFSAAQAKTEYVRWKSDRAKEFRANAPAKPAGRGRKAAAPEEGEEKAKGKGPTNAEVEEHYRSHPDYTRVNAMEQVLTAYAGLFEDAKKAIDMKAKIISSQENNMRGFERAERSVVQTEERHFNVPTATPPGPVYTSAPYPPPGPPAGSAGPGFPPGYQR